MNAAQLVWSNPTFRVMAIAMGLLGAMNASVYPYQSLVAIEVVGLSKPAFALVLILASACAVTTSVVLGILSDQRANRRKVAMFSAGAGVLAVSLMLVAPNTITLILAHAILLPLNSSLYGQIFSLTRLASTAHPAERDGVQATIRAMMSLSFLLALVFWTFAFGAGLAVMSVYVSAGLASIMLWGVIWRDWPRDGQTAWQDQPSGLNLRQAMAELVRPAVALRLLCLGAIGSAGLMYMVLISLVFSSTEGRGAADVALYVGLVAGCEVPFMLLLTRVAGRFSRSSLIAGGSVIYSCHLLLMPFLAATPFVWVLPVLAGLGGAATLTLPIAYYQNLMEGRPGAAASLLALQRLVGDVLCAAGFALGTTLGGYGLTASIGVGIAVAGAGGLYWADRTRKA